MRNLHVMSPRNMGADHFKLRWTIAGITSITVFIIIECYGYFVQILPVILPKNMGADHFNLIVKLPGVEPQFCDL